MRSIANLVVLFGFVCVFGELCESRDRWKRKASKVDDDVLLGKREDQCQRCIEILEGLRPQDGEAHMCVALLPEATGLDDPSDPDLVDDDLTVDGTGEDAARLKRLRNVYRKMARRCFRTLRKAILHGAPEMSLTAGQIAAIKGVYARIAQKNDVKYEVEKPATEAAEGNEVDENGNTVVKDPEDGVAEAQDENMGEVTGEPTPDTEPTGEPPHLTGGDEPEENNEGEGEAEAEGEGETEAEPEAAPAA